MLQLTRLERCGRYLFGLAAIVYGVTTFVWHDASIWQESGLVGNSYAREIVASTAALIEIVGGLMIQGSSTLKAGANLLAIVYFVFALLRVPLVVAQPRAYNS